MTAPVPGRAVEDAHLEVGEVDPVELRVARADGGPQRGVEGVDRAVALGRGDDPLAVDVHLHGGLGDEGSRSGSSSAMTRIDSTVKKSCSQPAARRMSSSSEASAASKW